MKSSKKGITLISVILAIALIIAAMVATFAYFSALKEVGLDHLTLTTTESGTENIVNLGSVYDLKVWARDDRYNVNQPTSEKSSRYILNFNADITLDENVAIDRDVNIVLNGYTLDLGAYNLTVRHSYAARMYLANTRYGTQQELIGKIVGEGKIVFDTPYAVTVLDDALSLFSERIEIAAFSEVALLQEIVAQIDNKISEYYASDIDLFTHFSGYPYKIGWTAASVTSEDIANTYVNSDGAVTLPEVGSAVVALGYSIKNADGREVAMGTKQVTILSETEAEIRLNIGKDFITGYFAEYLNRDGVTYNLFLSIGLPSNLVYYGLTFEYSTVVAGESGTSVDIIGSADGGDLALKRPDGARDIDLQVAVAFKYMAGGEQKKEVLYWNCRFVAVDGNNSNASQIVLDKIGIILIDDVTSVFMLMPLSDYAKYNILSIEYGIVDSNNIANTNYAVRRVVKEIDGVEKECDELYVSGGLPSYEQKIYLNLKIKYQTGRPIESVVKSQIFYIDATMGGGGAAGSDAFAYYHYLVTNSLLEKMKAGQTYVSFAMPKIWLNRVQVRYYLSDNGATDPYAGRITISYPENTDYAYFTIDRTKLKTTNEPIKIYFKYSTDIGEGVVWDSLVFYGKKVNDGVQEGVATTFNFLLSGILKIGQEILDETLFDLLWNEFNVSDMDAEKIITADELNFSAKRKLVIQDKTIGNYKGIEFLRLLTELSIINSEFNDGDFEFLVKLGNLQKLTLQGSNITGAQLKMLGQINFLSTLTLLNNKLSSGFDLRQSINLKELKLQNCAISAMGTLSTLTNLRTLYLNNVGEVTENLNTIRRFDGLANLEKLEKLYIYGNIIPSESETEAENFGSEGKYNTSALTLLSARGVDVYHAYSGSAAVLYTPTAEQTEGAYVVESLFYFGTVVIKNDTVTISLPHIIFTTSVAADKNYALAWNVVGNDTVGTVDRGANTVTFTLAATAGNRMELAVECTVGAAKVYRVIEIKAVAA